MAQDYGLTIEKPDGTVVAYLQSASSAEITYSLNAVGSLNINFDAASTDATAIYTTLATTLPVVRLARAGETVFTGPLESLDLNVADTGEISASFTDWAGVFARWHSYGKQKNIASNTIIDAFLSIARWPLSVQQLTRSGSVTATASASNAEQSTILEQIEQVSAVAPFDWYVDHANGHFKMASTHGSDLSATVRVGIGEVAGTISVANAQSARVTMQPPRNRIFTRTGKGKHIENQSTSAKTTSLANYGEFFENIDSGKPNAQSMANTYARYSPQQVIELSIDPLIGPAWLTDYFLGDTISVTVATNAYQASQSLRVNQIKVTLDEELVEVSNALTFEVV